MSASPLSTANDLWEIAAADCNLVNGQVYHYWFEVPNSNVYPGATKGTLRCTDPAAFTVDWRLVSAVPAGENALCGSVRDVVYLGETMHVVVTLPGGTDVTVALRNEGQLINPLPWRRGDDAAVAWRPEDCQILEDE